jgi:hypothetical protein
MRDRDLRASLASLGQLEPGLSFEGELLDGRRREPLCAELGRDFRVHVAASLQEACSVLWARGHRTRALELAGARPLVELAELCTTTASAIAQERAAARPKKSHKAEAKDSVTRLRIAPQMARKLIVLEPELFAAAKSAAKEVGHGNFSKFVREALRHEISSVLEGIRLPRRVQPPNGARRKTG